MGAPSPIQLPELLLRLHMVSRFGVALASWQAALESVLSRLRGYGALLLSMLLRLSQRCEFLN